MILNGMDVYNRIHTIFKIAAGQRPALSGTLAAASACFPYKKVTFSK